MLLESFTSLERLPWTIKLSLVFLTLMFSPLFKFNDFGRESVVKSNQSCPVSNLVLKERASALCTKINIT